MRGGDGQAGFAIRNPYGQFALPYQWKQNHEFDESNVQVPGEKISYMKYLIELFCFRLLSNVH